MKKIFLLFTFLFAASNLFGAYKVKIAVYKDHANLMTYISKIADADYKKNIIIEEKNHLYYVTSALYENENEVKKALSAYKKVFPDAFIVEEEHKTIVPVPTESVAQTLVPTEKVVQTPVVVEAVAQTPAVVEAVVQTPDAKIEQVPALEAKRLLENKTVYICNENGSQKAKKEVIRLDFKKEYVLYSKLSKNVPPIEIPYSFDQDCVILPMAGIDFKYQIHAEGDSFLSAKSFVNEKEGNHFRYYFDEEAALSFASGH